LTADINFPQQPSLVAQPPPPQSFFTPLLLTGRRSSPRSAAATVVSKRFRRVSKLCHTCCRETAEADTAEQPGPSTPLARRAGEGGAPRRLLPAWRYGGARRAERSVRKGRARPPTLEVPAVGPSPALLLPVSQTPGGGEGSGSRAGRRGTALLSESASE